VNTVPNGRKQDWEKDSVQPYIGLLLASY